MVRSAKEIFSPNGPWFLSKLVASLEIAAVDAFIALFRYVSGA
jgi:hypothetical protein